MNTNEYTIIVLFKQLVKLGKYFADFNFHGSQQTPKYREKLDDANIFHFTVPYFCRKLGKMSQNLSSAAVVVGALRVNLFRAE